MSRQASQMLSAWFFSAKPLHNTKAVFFCQFPIVQADGIKRANASHFFGNSWLFTWSSYEAVRLAVHPLSYNIRYRSLDSTPDRRVGKLIVVSYCIFGESAFAFLIPKEPLFLSGTCRLFYIHDIWDAEDQYWNAPLSRITKKVRAITRTVQQRYRSCTAQNFAKPSLTRDRERNMFLSDHTVRYDHVQVSEPKHAVR